MALSRAGLRALQVPQASLDGFLAAFREGMAGPGATRLGDTGERSPGHWDGALDGGDVHLAVSVLAPDGTALESLLRQAATPCAACQMYT